MGTAGQRGGQAGPGGSSRLGHMHEARSSALLAEFGNERGPSFLERCDLGPELLQLAVDLLQLGPGLLFPQVPLTMPGANQILDLTAQQPQPRVADTTMRPPPLMLSVAEQLAADPEQLTGAVDAAEGMIGLPPPAYWAGAGSLRG